MDRGAAAAGLTEAFLQAMLELRANSIRGVAHLATIDHEGDISTFLARHDYCPLRIDPQRHAVVFVQMSRETFRRSSFLDQRAILAGPATRFVDVDALFERLPSRPTERPTHFILHGAFCGSTLLARHFEELPHCLILKEPQLLAQIAGLGLRERWNDWTGAPFTSESRSHVSIWEKPASPPR